MLDPECGDCRLTVLPSRVIAPFRLRRAEVEHYWRPRSRLGTPNRFVNEKRIASHIPVIDKSKFSREDFHL